MKKLLFIFLLSHLALSSQNDNSLVISSNTFTAKEGYLISSPYYSVYDNNGWLWVIGRQNFSNELVIGEKETIIQRFDGANFFTFKLPNTFGKEITKGQFIKYKDEGLYLKLSFKGEREKLYYIDTQTLEFFNVDDFNNLPKKYKISQEYIVGDKTRLIITSVNKFYSFELNKLNLKLIDSISFNKPYNNPFIDPIITTDKFSIIKLLNEKEFCFLNDKGKIISKLSDADFIDSSGKHFWPNRINGVYKNNNEYYFSIDDYKNAFKFNAKEVVFKEIPETRTIKDNITRFQFSKDYKYGQLKQEVGTDYIYKMYSFNNAKPQLLATVKSKSFSSTVSNNPGNDLVVFDGNNLNAYYFTKSKIKTYLKDKSIRTIKKYKNHKYIVATDNEGFYIVDVEKNTEEKIKFILDNKEIAINYSRDIIFIDDNTIITNDSHNLYTLDSTFNIKNNKLISSVGEEIIKVKENIFTGYDRGTVYKYNLNLNEFAKIQGTEDIGVKEFASDGEKLFATTSKGIFEYKNEVFKTYEFKNEITDNFLSITYEKEFGVLVSTKLGKLYQLDTINKKLNLLYEDALKASIVGMVADNSNNLWLNTYAGIVSFNPQTKKTVRFTTKDGIYELEGNRYSTYKDSDNNILIGSYKGLSFFNPQELKESKFEQFQPQFTSVSYFNSEENSWKINSSPDFLKDLKEITLPPEYQRFSANISILGHMNAKDIRFRSRLIESGDDNAAWFSSYPGKEIFYANLSGGVYTLQVEAFSTANNKIGETISLKIISKKFFYKTWWFWVITILVALSIIVFFLYQYKTKQQLHAKNSIAINEAKIKNEMMLEIHHRIKNNLQIVSGLLGLQMMNSTNKELIINLQDSQSRIESIAGIHNSLYSENDSNVITIKENIVNIINYYKILFTIKVNYVLDIDDSVLNMDKATPFSLLLNELINNSNKHAFSAIENPEIYVTFKKVGSKYMFEYADNGNFKKQNNSKSMGMRIVEMMRTQLKATMKIENDKNFKLILHF